jgi:hypothetical protein
MTNDIPDAAVVITPREVYDRVLGMEKNVSDVKGLLEQVVLLQKERDKTVDTRLEDHSKQLGSQDTRLAVVEVDVRILKEAAATSEKRRAPWWAIVGAVVGIISGVGGMIALFLTLATLAQAYQQIQP